MLKIVLYCFLSMGGLNILSALDETSGLRRIELNVAEASVGTKSVGAKNGGQAKGAKPNALEQFFPFILIGIGMYFVFIRPQQKRHRQHRDFLSKIQRGDEVLTSSGIYGKVEGLTESFIILEVAEGVRMRVEKSHINSYALDETSQREVQKR